MLERKGCPRAALCFSAVLIGSAWDGDWWIGLHLLRPAIVHPSKDTPMISIHSYACSLIDYAIRPVYCMDITILDSFSIESDPQTKPTT